jgi:hypothetical protein
VRPAAPVVPPLLVVPASASGGLGIAEEAAVVAVVSDAVETGTEGAELEGALGPLWVGPKEAATAAAASSLFARRGRTAFG